MFKNFERKFLLNRANTFLKTFEKYIEPKSKILDFGAGSGSFTQILRSSGHKITPIDIVNKSLNKGVQPIIYNGKTLNYPNNFFDLTLVITVLHHTPDPEKLLKEISRVSKRIVIIEDIYSNKIEELITKFFDSIWNWEWKGHPHSNKNDMGWKQTFDKLNLKILHTEHFNKYLFKLVTYVLEKKP